MADPYKSWFDEDIQAPGGVIARPTCEADVIEILRNTSAYPSPVRPVGSRHSMTPCISARGPQDAGREGSWGTLVDMTAFDYLSDASGRRTGESLRIDRSTVPATVRVPAGRTFIKVAHALRDEGLQFRVNTELGTLTMGAAACGATKDSSFPDEFGQVCSDVVGMRVVLPNGETCEYRAGNLDDEEVLAALRCSYGLFGIVTEVTFRVYPLQYISIWHDKVKPENDKRFTSSELRKHLHRWLDRNRHENAVFLYLFPYRHRIVAEMRHKPSTGEGEKKDFSFRLKTRNKFWKEVIHDWNQVTRGTPIPRALQDAFDKVLATWLEESLRLCQVNPVAQIVDFDKDDPGHKFTFSMWAFREAQFPEILPRYFTLCEKHEATYRSCLPHVSYHIAQDANSTLSYSFEEPVWTLDPICPQNEPGWAPFLDEFNEFCSDAGGVPLLNQTPRLSRAHLVKAFGPRLGHFEAKRREFDPQNRMLNDYFARLLKP
jgi:FAD/FMN-containing dehydrogenase